MKLVDNIKNLFKNSKIIVGTDIDKKILHKAISALPPQAPQPDKNIWSTIMHSKITKLSGIAAIILLIAMLTIMNKTAPKAWAIEQTIDAFKDIQTVKLECYGADFGNYDAYIRRTGDDWTSFQCLGEKADNKLFGLIEGYMYYWYEPGSRVIYQQDFSKGGLSGSCASELYSEAVKMAPVILPYAKTLFQTFKMLASEWKETYKTDPQTGRDSVFVTCSYEPLSMSFEGVFDIESKLVVRAKVWNNSTFEREPDLVINKIVYNSEIEDERFDFEKRFGVPVFPHEECVKASRLLRKGLEFRKEGKLEEAIAAWQELYETYHDYWEMPEALNMMGDIYKTKNQYNKAIEYYQKILDEYTYSDWATLDAYFNIGSCYKEMNETRKAIEALEKCLETVKSRSVSSDPEYQERCIKQLEAKIKELQESL